MSGGGNKKKPTKTQGWEEAGSEFYQESYPTADGELDILQKDPRHLATLLPSKQTRAVATTVQATIRMRTNDNRTVRRQSSSRSRRESTVHRRTSTTQDVQVSMLPDLSENISNEQTAWEEIMQIKAMPLPMAQKKEMRSKIINQPNLRLQGYEQFKWKRRKMWRRFQSRLADMYDKLELWRGALKRIEGHFGIGVVSYFLFIKWLLFINIFIFSAIFLFIILPTVLLDTDICQKTESENWILDSIQGTGFMKCTVLYYGFYSNETFTYKIGDTNMYYNLPLAYICVMLLCFIVSLIRIVQTGAKDFKERLIEGEGQFYLYCNLVFGGWDYCIHNGKSADIKHNAIYHEIRSCLVAERMEEERQNRSRNEKTKLYIIRIIVNLLVIAILGACGCGIYFAFDFSISITSVNSKTEGLDIENLFYEFLPSLTIVCFNILVPFVFHYLIMFENYSQLFIVKLTLVRTVFVRLASLIVLYATLYSKISCNVSKVDDRRNCTESPCLGNMTTHSQLVYRAGKITYEDGLDCWETYVGQQLYKLYLTNFATNVIITFFINFPRAMLAKHINNKFFILIGEQSFDLPKHVLDIVYSQTLCWLGCFYSPLLSAMGVICCFLTFYIKKFVCLVNSKPSVTIYRASRSNSMFMIVVLISFVFALIPVAFSVAELVPSSSCGPFRDFCYAWESVEKLIAGTPTWIASTTTFLTTAGFGIPVLIVLVMLLYYFTAVNSANRHMVTVLKNQLVLEGHDKQFLLDRLSLFIKQQQENQKRIRRMEASRDIDRSISNA